MERNLDDRACELAVYMLEHNATVRAAAAKFGVSKSTVHMEVTITSGSYGVLDERKPQDVVESRRAGAEAPAFCVFFGFPEVKGTLPYTAADDRFHP